MDNIEAMWTVIGAVAILLLILSYTPWGKKHIIGEDIEWD